MVDVPPDNLNEIMIRECYYVNVNIKIFLIIICLVLKLLTDRVNQEAA